MNYYLFNYLSAFLHICSKRGGTVNRLNQRSYCSASSTNKIILKLFLYHDTNEAEIEKKISYDVTLVL